MPNAIFQLDESQVLADHEARLRRLESTNYAVGLGASFQLLATGTGSGSGFSPFNTSWTPEGLGGTASFSIAAQSQQVTTRNILILGTMNFCAYGTINSFAVYCRLGVATAYGGAYVTPNSGRNPSDVCSQTSTNTLTANSTATTGTFWTVMNLNAGSYVAYYQYSMDSGSTTQIEIFGTPSIAVFAFG